MMIKMETNFKLGRYWLDQIKQNGDGQMGNVHTLDQHQLKGLVIHKVQQDLRRVVDYTKHLNNWYQRTDIDTLVSQVMRDTATLMLTDIDYEKYFNAHIGSREDFLADCRRTVQFDKEMLKNSLGEDGSDQLAHHLGSDRMRLFLYQDQKPIQELKKIPTDYVMRQVDDTSFRAYNMAQSWYRAVDGDVLVYYSQRLIIALGQVQDDISDV